jgi:hypothetical protein
MAHDERPAIIASGDDGPWQTVIGRQMGRCPMCTRDTDMSLFELEICRFCGWWMLWYADESGVY